tara:strand:+ start:3874 stop:5712 length:1839 start_codon:yes stop_codon:yes gene_type:complete
MDSLNLDIDSYTPFDLQKLFSLTPEYTVNDVKKGFNKLVQQLEKTKSLGFESKQKINNFIKTAADYLASQSGASDPNAGTWAMSQNPMDSGSSHYVISNPNTLAGRNASITDGRQAGTDDVPSGWLNPINVRTVMHGINIDTRFRDNYYQTSSSNFTFDLPNPQKKVTNMRIATLDIPMTYYSVNRDNGSSTMIIFPQPIDYESSQEMKDEKTAGQTITPLQNVWYSATDVELTTNNSTSTAANGAIDFFFNNNNVLQATTVSYGLWQGGGKYSVLSTLPEPTLGSSDSSNAASYRAGWLLVLPDGNYEMAWQSQSYAMDITRAMNNAIARAQPCLIDRGSGTAYILLSESPTVASTALPEAPTTLLGYQQYAGNPGGYVPFINAGLGGKIVFSVDRASGRSVFALPDTQTSKSIISQNGSTDFETLPDTPNTTGPSIDQGFELVFAVDGAGNFNPESNIQLRLGWQLGFRIGQYSCLGYLYSSGESGLVYLNATSVISEGICMISGPRYMFLSIDDGNNNVGSNFTAIFAESTLGEHVMTRINLSSTMDSTGIYKCASDAGLSNQLNRTREYFGPVNISRLKIKLMDEYGRIIDLNDMDWSMSIVFEKLYD